MSLQQALERLRTPHPAVQSAAVAAVFDLAARTQSAGQRDAAFAECLSHSSQAVVEAAVQALLALPAEPAAADAVSPQDLLLTALSLAGPATAAPLAAGILRLYERQLSRRPPTAPQPQPATAWRAHPLSRALLSNAAATQPVVLGIARMLARATESSGSPAAFAATLAALRPFLSFLLLDPQLAAAQPLLPSMAHAALARVACCASSSAAQLELLGLLVAHLPALRVTAGDLSGAQQAAAAVADVMDVVESCCKEPGADTVAALASHLICLCHEAAAAEAPALLQQLLAALSALAGYWPGAVAVQAASLGALLLQHPTAQLLSAAGAEAALALLATLLQHLAQDVSCAAVDREQLASLLLLPLLQQAACGGSKEPKQWACHAMSLLRSLPAATSRPSSSGCSTTQPMQLHGTAATVHIAEQLLARLWQRPLEAQHWLASLRFSLAAPAVSSSSREEGSRPSKGEQQLDRGTLLVASALLQHPSETVQRAALKALVAAMAATPLLGLSLLPLIVHQLQHQVESFLSGKVQRPQRQLLELLHALAEAGRHTAVLPFVLRTLQPLLSAGTPEILQAAGLRLLCRLWHTSGGRAYQQLRAAVIGYAAPGQSAGLALRVARAECLRDICTTDPDKAVELVGLVQECLADDSPAVVAAGLDCVALLCEADVLEFYAAWRVVHRTLPRLREHPAAAAAWVRLLGSGGLDAAVQPDAAAAIIDALWLAAAHKAPQVRCQAYASLAAYAFDTLEGIEALRPLCAYAALLHSELRHQQETASSRAPPCARQRRAAAAALAACEALVQAALAHEHATRRHAAGRAGSAGGRVRSSAATGAASGGAAMVHRLQSTLPKQLLGGSAASTADLLQRLPDLPAVAVQLFFAPPPPPATSSKAAAAAAAKHAAADYQAVFQQLLRQPAGLPNAAEDAGEAAQILAAWRSFLRRWLAAERAAAKQVATSQQQAAADAAMQLWAVMEPALGGSEGGTPAAAANAVWAAAALCLATQQPLPVLVTAVHSRLASTAAGGVQHSAAAQRAALAALGSLAEALRLALRAPALEATLRLLHAQLHSQQSGSSSTTAAALTGLGLACAALCSSGDTTAAAGSTLPPAAEQLVQSSLAAILSCMSASWLGDGDSLVAAAATVGPPPASAQLPSASEALPSAAAALAAALPAAASVLTLSDLLAALVQQTRAVLQQQPAEEAATTAALCGLIEAASAAGFASGCISAEAVSSALAQLLSLASSQSDGRIVGAAAAAAGSLLAAALSQGLAPTEQQSAPAVLQQLLAVPAHAARLPQAAAAKRGAAAGVAAVLEAGTIDPGSQQFKAAVAALEALALIDPDPRTRRACSVPLAKLCHAVKRAGSLGGGAAASATDVQGVHKGLLQLPADGALRPLLESLLEGHWVLPTGQEDDAGLQLQTELSAAESAALLRCLASAQRLPALNYGTLCRRLLRSHSSDADLYAAVAAFAAAQGSRQQQQHHLADFAAELLDQGSQETAPAWQLQALLEHLQQLLAALPEAQAVAALGTLCLHAAAPDASGRQAQLLPLLRGMVPLLKDSPSPALRQAAQQTLVTVLLPALQQPSHYPLALAPEAEAPVPLSVRQRCWAAAAQCLRLLPAEQLESALQQPALLQQLPLHAAAAASAMVDRGKLDERALQHPRNLLLGGSGCGQPLGPAALLVGRAVGSLAPAKQQQWLLDVLDACKSSANPRGSLQLAACIASSSAAAAMHSSCLAAQHALCAGSAAAAVLSLPATLPVLLGSAAWQHSGAAALLLQQLAAALQVGQQADGQQVLQQCLLAARGWLPAEMWPRLASLL